MVFRCQDKNYLSPIDGFRVLSLISECRCGNNLSCTSLKMADSMKMEVVETSKIEWQMVAKEKEEVEIVIFKKFYQCRERKTKQNRCTGYEGFVKVPTGSQVLASFGNLVKYFLGFVYLTSCIFSK